MSVMMNSMLRRKVMPKRIPGDCNHTAYNSEARARIGDREVYGKNFDAIKWKSRRS